MSLLLLFGDSGEGEGYSSPIVVPPFDIEIAIGVDGGGRFARSQETPGLPLASPRPFGLPPLRNQYIRAIDNFDITYTLGNRAILHCQAVDPDSALVSAYRPDTNQRVIIQKTDGTVLFNGRVADMRESSMEPRSGFGVLVDIDAINDWEALDHIFIDRKFGSDRQDLMWTSTGSAGTLYRTPVPHGLSNGDIVTIEDVRGAPGFVNGTYAISIHDAFHFGVASLTGSPQLGAGGTVRGRVYLKTALDYIATLISAWGISLDPTTLPGPLLESMAFDGTVASALADLQKASGWVNRLLPTNVLQSFEPGTKVADFTINGDTTLGTPNIQKSRSNYANIIEVSYGQSLASGKTDAYFGDGSTRTFPLTYRPNDTGEVEYYFNSTKHKVGTYGVNTDTEWVYRADLGPNGSLVQLAVYDGGATTPIGPNLPIAYRYSVAFPKKARVPASQTIIDDAGGPWVKRVDAPNIFDITSAEAFGQEVLAESLIQPRRVTFDTRTGLIFPGTTLTMDIPGRLLDGSDWLVMFTRMTEDEDGAFRYTYQAIEDNSAQPGWIEYLKGLRGSGGGAGSSSASPSHFSGGSGGGGGGMGGSGTTDRLAKFITATSIGDSIMREIASASIEILGALSTTGIATAQSFTGRSFRGVSNAGNDFILQSATGGSVISVPTGTLTTNFHGAVASPAGTSLIIAPAVDLILAPVSDLVQPDLPYSINLGRLQRKFLTLHAAELWVETLVAQNTMATIGGRILVGPTSALTVDLAPSDLNVILKHNNFAVGDRVYMESDGKVEFMAIASAAVAVSNGYQYAVIRNLDGSGANQWYAGDAMFNTGQAGNGFIDIYSTRGVRAGTEIGPTIAGNVRNSFTYNDWEPRWIMGNLKGFYDYGVDVYGATFGKGGGPLITIETLNGIRMYDGLANLRVHITPAGAATFTGIVNIQGGNGALADMSNVTTIDGGKITTNTITASKINVSSLSAIQANVGNLVVNSGGTIVSTGMGWSTGGPGFYIGWNGVAYGFAIGNWSGNRMYWDGSNLVVVANYVSFGSITMDANGITIPNGSSGSGSRIFIGGAILHATSSGRFEVTGNMLVNGYIQGNEMTIFGNVSVASGGSLTITGTLAPTNGIDANGNIHWTNPATTDAADQPLVRSPSNGNVYVKTDCVTTTISVGATSNIVVENGLITGVS